jgi:hypothetical protein
LPLAALMIEQFCSNGVTGTIWTVKGGVWLIGVS